MQDDKEIRREVTYSVLCTTKPTELISAIRTSHVITSFILLNRCLAVRTRFCIFLLPLFKLLVSFAVFYFPLTILFTRSSMPTVVTLETKFKLTFGTHDATILWIANYWSPTSWTRTPPAVWIWNTTISEYKFVCVYMCMCDCLYSCMFVREIP
jgi:hypothetical protein